MYRVEVLFPAFLYKMGGRWVGLEQGPVTIIVFDIYVYFLLLFPTIFSLVVVFLSNVAGGGGGGEGLEGQGHRGLLFIVF